MFSYQSTSLTVPKGTCLYALLDCAVDIRAWKTISGCFDESSHIKLFKGTFAAGAEQYSPVLLDMASTKADSSAVMRKLLAACEGKPALSFISSVMNLHEIADHLRSLLILKTADHQEFLLRYADNRMLPAIWSVLAPAQQQAFLGKINTWVVSDHWSSVHVLTAPSEIAEKIPDLPLTIDDGQLAQLLERTEIYAILAQIEKYYEPFSSDISLGARIQFVDRNIKLAKETGFHDTDALLSWCMAVHRGGSEFFTHPRIRPLLKDALAGEATLGEVLSELHEKDWEMVISAVKNKGNAQRLQSHAQATNAQSSHLI